MAQVSASVLKEYFYDMPIDLFCVIRVSDRQILQANPSFEYILGWKPEEMVGQLIDTFVNSEMDKANIEKAFAKINLDVHTLTFETEFRSKNNSFRWIDWKCYIDDEKQNIFAIGRDVTTLKETQKQLLQQSLTDRVTGVADRQTFLKLLQKELIEGMRLHHATSVIMVDIDHFKNFNERFGIQKGDDCLRQVATALKTCLRRKTDFLARFENDEFAVLLSHNNLEKAIKSAEYLRSSLEKFALRQESDKTHQPITISLGVASVAENATKEVASEVMLASAQHALSVSQHRGGNQVNYAEELGS